LRRAILLSGPRRVGKTTILMQLAEAALAAGRAPNSVCYLSLDHPALSRLPLSRLLQLYHAAVMPEGQPALLLLDEVHYSQQWDLHLKQMIDHRPEYRLVATGSASLEHQQRLAESGVGRWITVPVPTLSFDEFLRIRGEEVAGLPADLTLADLWAAEPGQLALLAGQFRPIMPLFGRYLLLGGFPEPALKDEVAFCQQMLREDIIDRVLKRDMPALFHIRNLDDLEKLFVYLCIHSGGIFSVTRCANALGSTKTTVSNYLTALEQAKLVHLLPPFRREGKKALKAPPKVYLVDAALRNAVLLKGEEVLTDADEMGGLVETTVLRHLMSRYHRDTPEVTYWRESSRGREVDFIVRTPKYTVAVEVKYRAGATTSDIAALLGFCAENTVDEAYWVTQREQHLGRAASQGAGARVLRVPAHIFVYLLGQVERRLWSEQGG